MNWYSVLIDVILLAVVALFVFASAKRGFVRVVVEAVGIVAAVIFTLTVCTPLSVATYDKIIEPPIISATNEQVHDTVEETVKNVIESLPDFLQGYIESSGIADQIVAENNGEISNSTTDYITEISQNSIKPVVVRILSTIYSIIIFTVAVVIVKILAGILNKTFSFSIVGNLNKTLGGLCGLIKGVAFVLVLCYVIKFLLPITDNGIWIFNAQNIEQTYIFRFLISLGEF